MLVKKIKLKNFKKFTGDIFEFNDDVNILVGDNASGKSTILEAIEIATNCTHRGKPLLIESTLDLFNNVASKAYLEGNLRHESLPEVEIEVFLEGVPDYRGTNNSLGEDAEGIAFKISFDSDLIDKYEELARTQGSIQSIPVEFFKLEWFDFSWKQIKAISRKTKSALIDPSRLHPTLGKNQYITGIMASMLSKEQLAHLKLDFRQLKHSFDGQEHVQLINKELEADKTISNDTLKVVADLANGRGIEGALQLAVNEVSLPYVGKGEQNQIQIKLAIQNRAKSVNFLLLEEPENHLSHMNLTKLVNYINEHRNGLQVFISTHSSYVLNKLSIAKLCLIGTKFHRLKDINAQVAQKIQRLPGYDTLRAALASRVILVEGPSDELILKKCYLSKHGKLPEDAGIEIIVVHGIGFETYLEIAKGIGTYVNVVKDNDGNYQQNIDKFQKIYAEHKNIKFFSPTDNKITSLEPALIAQHAESEKALDSYSNVILSTQTYNSYLEIAGIEAKVKFLKDWFAGEKGSGTKKVDSAMRIFNSDQKISYPDYLVGAFDFA